MTAQILFHPELKLTEAYRLAREQGGMLVYSMGRVRIHEAMRHNDEAAAAIEAGEYDAALVSLRAAHEAIFGGEPLSPALSREGRGGKVQPCAA